MSHVNEGAPPFLTLEDVTLKVGGGMLFEGVNWTIRADQQWALIGPNGAGKSILAKALCHEVDVVHGRIRYFFDSVGVYQAYTPAQAETARQWLAAFGVAHLAERPDSSQWNAPASFRVVNAGKLKCTIKWGFLR